MLKCVLTKYKEKYWGVCAIWRVIRQNFDFDIIYGNRRTGKDLLSYCIIHSITNSDSVMISCWMRREGIICVIYGNIKSKKYMRDTWIQT